MCIIVLSSTLPILSHSHSGISQYRESFCISYPIHISLPNSCPVSLETYVNVLVCTTIFCGIQARSPSQETDFVFWFGIFLRLVSIAYIGCMHSYWKQKWKSNFWPLCVIHNFVVIYGISLKSSFSEAEVSVPLAKAIPYFWSSFLSFSEAFPFLL